MVLTEVYTLESEVESEVEYEGSTLYGVFGTPEKAMQYVKENWKLKNHDWVESKIEPGSYSLPAKFETFLITKWKVE